MDYGNKMKISELQTIADLAAKELGLNIRPTIQVRDVNTGRARRKTNKITIPLWATQRVREYAIYYVIHEVCHFIEGAWHHTPKLKKLEQGILKRLGIKIEYAKVYPKALYGLDGKKLCGKSGKKE